MCARHGGNQARDRRLTGSRRTPQNDRLQRIALDRLPQRPARRQQILLADELVEVARPHPVGEGRRRRRLNGRLVVEQARVGHRFQLMDSLTIAVLVHFDN